MRPSLYASRSWNLSEDRRTDAAAVGSAVSRGVEKYEGIDGVILNAGVLEPMGKIASDGVPIEQWKQHFDVNFFSLVTAIRATLPELRRSSHGGRLVFMSSGAATGNIPGWGPYNASKAAMNSLCRQVSLRSGVREGWKTNNGRKVRLAECTWMKLGTDAPPCRDSRRPSASSRNVTPRAKRSAAEIGFTLVGRGRGGFGRVYGCSTRRGVG